MRNDDEIILTTYTCITLNLIVLTMEVIHHSKVRIHHIHLKSGLRSGNGAIKTSDGKVIPFRFRYAEYPNEYSEMFFWVLDKMHKVQFDFPEAGKINVTEVTKLFPEPIPSGFATPEGQAASLMEQGYRPSQVGITGPKKD